MVSFFGHEVIVVITSDHGDEFGDHGQWGHGQSLYQELVRVPLVVQGEGFTRGVIDARLESRDVFHLLAGLASGEAADLGGWGKDHDRAVRTISTYRRSVGRWWLMRPYHAVRKRGVEDRGWLMIRSAFGGVDELYDLTSDHTAMRNLADRYPEVVDRLWKARMGEVGSYRRPVRSATLEQDLEQLRALGYVE